MKRWAVAVLYYGLIFFLSSFSHFDPRLNSVTIHDKAIHFFVFGLFGLIFAWAYLRQNSRLNWKQWIVAVFVLLGVGFFDELHQHFVPGRNVDFFDWLADCLGALTFFLIYYYRNKYVAHRISTF